MFKKKSSLPARPLIPSKEEILEDLTHATPDDIVFNSDGEKCLLSAGEVDSLNVNTENLEGCDLANSTECNNPHQAYIKVESFLEKMNHLEKSLLELQKEKESLKHLEQGLLTDMIKVEEEFKKRSESSHEN